MAKTTDKSVGGKVLQLMPDVGPNRLRPPFELTDAQRSLWLATVNSRPSEWFGPEHVPLLVLYVKHAATADMLTRQIEAFDPKWLEDEAGIKRMNALTSMRAREAQCMKSLARSMRLTQQSLYRANKAAT